MSPIRILSSHLSSQISAGEVIDRPSSVVKELIENSIDAKAKNIDISIEKTGFQSIIVKDDGNGIEKDQLLLAISRHATSKINTLSDLNNINTFGFRGEALASIRAVSRLKLISCFQNNNIGWSIYSEGSSKYTVLQPIAHPIGTSVVVENLFYNIPVRLKFIKNKTLEFLKIYEVIKKISLSCFDINISFKKNKKLFVSYNAIKKNDEKIYRLKTIFNEININHVLEIREKFDNIKLFGWLIFPLSSSFKKIQYSYVNNRFIYNKTINKAVFDAFNTMIGNKNISFILYITLPPNEVDINIHPTKNEIKFRNIDIVYFFLYRSILNNLKRINIKYFLQNFSSKIELDPKNNFFLDVNLLSNYCKKKSLCNNIISINTFVESKKNFENKFFSFGRLLAIFQKYYGLVHSSDDLLLISFPLAKKIVDQNKLKIAIEKKIIPDFFSFYFTFFITLEQKKILFKNSQLLLRFGFHFVLKEKYIILKKIPIFLKNQNLNFLLPDFFSFIFFKKKVFIKDIFNWFDANVVIEKKSWTYLDGISLLLEIENFCSFIFKKPPLKLLQKINIKEALCILKI